MSLGNYSGGLVGRNAFYPGGVDTFYNVVIRQTSLDCAIDIRRLGVNRRVQQLIRSAAACRSIDVVAHDRNRRTTGRLPTQVGFRYHAPPRAAQTDDRCTVG